MESRSPLLRDRLKQVYHNGVSLGGDGNVNNNEMLTILPAVFSSSGYYCSASKCALTGPVFFAFLLWELFPTHL